MVMGCREHLERRLRRKRVAAAGLLARCSLGTLFSAGVIRLVCSRLGILEAQGLDGCPYCLLLSSGLD